jgi:hypothetical protein
MRPDNLLIAFAIFAFASPHAYAAKNRGPWSQPQRRYIHSSQQPAPIGVKITRFRDFTRPAGHAENSAAFQQLRQRLEFQIHPEDEKSSLRGLVLRLMNQFLPSPSDPRPKRDAMVRVFEQIHERIDKQSVPAYINGQVFEIKFSDGFKLDVNRGMVSLFHPDGRLYRIERDLDLPERMRNREWTNVDIQEPKAFGAKRGWQRWRLRSKPSDNVPTRATQFKLTESLIIGKPLGGNTELTAKP